MKNATTLAAQTAAAHLESLLRDGSLAGSRAATYREIRNRWALISHRAAVALDGDSGLAFRIPAPSSILGSSRKTDKAERASTVPAAVTVCYMAPADMLSRTIGGGDGVQFSACSNAHRIGCVSPCLGGNDGRGHLSMPNGTARRAQLGRLALLIGSPVLWARACYHDIQRAKRAADRDGRALFVRLDGTTDLGVAWIRNANGGTVADALESIGVTAFDYTKVHSRARLATGSVVFSAAPRSMKAARAILDNGGTVSAVAADTDPAAAVETIRAHFPGYTVINGDASEPLTREPGTVRALTLKAGSAESRRRGALSPLTFNR